VNNVLQSTSILIIRPQDKGLKDRTTIYSYGSFQPFNQNLYNLSRCKKSRVKNPKCGELVGLDLVPIITKAKVAFKEIG
jgi:hypothetical protein